MPMACCLLLLISNMEQISLFEMIALRSSDNAKKPSDKN
ncbi:Putative uncharacterized protein [Moritella viscosa]|nr:Putative uncharacterized protein [Moritella viscosa]